MRTQILFEDDEILVCKKVPGIAVETKSISQTDMVSELKKYRKQKGESTYIGVVHRLDQPVEGIIVFAKNEKAAAALSKQVQAPDGSKDSMDKIYTATVFGHMKEKAGVIEDYLVKNGKDNTSRVGSKGEKDAKYSKLEYTVTASDEETDTLRIKLYTGRHHQIRVQMANNGTPILGDMKYGSDASKDYSASKNIKNVSLVASEISFTHTKSGKRMTFVV